MSLLTFHHLQNGDVFCSSCAHAACTDHSSSSYCAAVDFDPLAASKVKGISNAILVVEPHPSSVDETVIVVCTSSGEATIWHSADARCSCLRSCAVSGPNIHGSIIQLGIAFAQIAAQTSWQV